MMDMMILDFFLVDPPTMDLVTQFGLVTFFNDPLVIGFAIERGCTGEQRVSGI